MKLTRRTFLQSATALSVTHTLPVFAAIERSLFHGSEEHNATTSLRLSEGWEYYQGSLDPSFQVWHSEELLSWEKVTLPHCFNHYDACDPDEPAYRGPGWYRTMLSVANPYSGGRTLLHFEGAGQSSRIYIGDMLVGEHTGGYNEFVVDITDAVANRKKVQLAVLCDNGRNISRMPSDLSDFTLYGGLYRPVRIIYVPPVSLEAVHTRVSWEPGKDAEVSVSGRLYAPVNSTGSLTLEIRISSPDGKLIHHQKVSRESCWQGEIELAKFRLEQPIVWAPDSPSLYQCEASLRHAGLDSTASHRFGILHTRWEEHGPFFLNGKRLLLRGTQRHEDHAGYAAAMPDDLIRQELRMIKDMGANFVRLAHYQQARLVLDLCDELGLFVWEELPWCRSGVVNQTFQAQGKAKLATMIDQHSNHPCVLLWGLGNEDDWPTEPNGDDHTAIRNYMTELRDLAHRLDPTRLTSYRRCDFARDIPDVYSPSIWAGWYSGAYKEYRSALEKVRPTVKHLFHAEWGADSHAGRHAEDPDPVMGQVSVGGNTAETGFDYKLHGGALRMAKDGEWSETYACDLFDWYLKTLEEVPWLTGSAQWVFKDFTTPLRVENPIPRINQKGLVTRDMQPKEGYYVFQSYWSKEPILRIYGHSWPIRWGRAGQKRLVRVYSNCGEVELFLNGQSVGVRKRDASDFPCAGLRWELPFAVGANELRAVANLSGRTIQDTVQFHYETQPWGEPVKFSLATVRRVANRTTVQVELLDRQGKRCLDARTPVRFSLAGSGRLVDNLGTPTGSRAVQLYNGRAEISVDHLENVTIYATSSSLESDSLILAATNRRS